MPWLVKPENGAKPEEHLLFVHVPRCGGTSLTQHFSVPERCLEGRSLWGQLGMKIFFQRYKTFENANFPIWTIDNAVLFTIFLAGFAKIHFANEGDDSSTMVGYGMMALSATICAFTTFICTAPVIGRWIWVRRGFLYFVHYCLFQFMESIDWITGTNKTGYMMHLTAQKLLRYEYVTPEQMNKACSMAIVRNPYSRMVSIYLYNRYGPTESFGHFMKDWYKQMKYYRESGETEEWYTPCHCIPQHEFTHFEGKQLVQSIVKQEELKYLKNKKDINKAVEQDSTVLELPDLVRDALLGMPHKNKRQSSGKQWWDYYDQETLNMTYELYKTDFQVFEYSAALDKRPDLRSPTMKKDVRFQSMLRDSTSVRCGSSRAQQLTLLKRASNSKFTISSKDRMHLEALHEESLRDLKKDM